MFIPTFLLIDYVFFWYLDGTYILDDSSRFFSYKLDKNLQIPLNILAQHMSVDEGLPYEVVYNILLEKDTKGIKKFNFEQYLNALQNLETLKKKSLSSPSEDNHTSNQNKSDSADRI